MKDEHEMIIPFGWEERQKWLDLPIPVAEYHTRISRLQEMMKENKIDCMIVYGGVSDKANLQYVCGYDSWWGDTMVYIPPEGLDLIFVTNAVFHGEPAHSNMHTQWVKEIRFVLHPHSAEKPKNISDLIAGIIKEKGYVTGRIAICNEQKVPFYLLKQLEVLLPAAEISSGTSYLQKLRRLKSPSEIALFRKACECTDAALNKAFDSLEVGITERDLYAIMAKEAFARGAHRFMASVTFGPRSSLKNIFIPGEYKLKEGEIVSLDVVSSVAGYSTDTHRNGMLGRPKDDLPIRMMEAVLEAGFKVLEKTGPGVVIHDLQKIMYEYVEKAGFLPYDFTKVLFAHGCGLDLVEEPFFFWGNKSKLEPGMTFYLEPCLVKHGLGTACWESLILIIENGYERLSKAKDKNW